jgi:hypothetical protein
MKLSVLGASALVCLAIGCGGGDKTGTASDALTVHGTVPRSTLVTDNAKAIAVSASGHVYTAYLDRQGDFTLNLPAGHAYRVLIANTLPSGRHSVVGRLTLANRTTGTSAWLGARSAGNIDLGNLHTGSANGLSIQCSCSSGGSSGGDSSGGDGSYGSGSKSGGDDDKSGGSYGSGDGDHHGDDYGCHEDDGEKGNMCSGGGEGDLHAQHDPGSYCDDSGLDDDQDKNEDDGPSCSGKGGEGSDKGSGSDGSYGSGSGSSSSGSDSSSSSGGGTTGSDSSGTSNAGSSCGCQAEGNPCHCNSDCQNGQVCVAGYCSK